MRFAPFLASILPALAAASVLTACSLFTPYRIDIRQGNHIDEAMLAQLKPGMTREQVRFALGTPLVADVFHSSRWDYVYSFKSGKSGETQQRTVSIFFADDRLDRIEGDTAQGENTETRSRIIEVPKAED